MNVVAQCRGKNGCRRDPGATSTTCDVGGAEAGDPCEGEGSHCAADGRTVLTCSTDHHYIAARECRGAKGCRRIAGQSSVYVVCDVSVGEIGDPCDAREAAAATVWCSKDGRDENHCVSGRLAHKEECPGGCIVRWGEDARAYEISCLGR